MGLLMQRVYTHLPVNECGVLSIIAPIINKMNEADHFEFTGVLDK